MGKRTKQENKNLKFQQEQMLSCANARDAENFISVIYSPPLAELIQISERNKVWIYKRSREALHAIF